MIKKNNKNWIVFSKPIAQTFTAVPFYIELNELLHIAVINDGPLKSTEKYALAVTNIVLHSQ